MKKLALVLVLVFVFALPVLANPFADVPLNHWAYDSVQSLAAKGVIVGYPDGTFGGGRTMTRYEFAEAVAKALAYVEGMDFASADDVAVLEKLAIEFADELANLGVTVADLEAAVGANSAAITALEETVAKHELFFEPIKVTGRFRATYVDDFFAMPGYTRTTAYAGATLVDDTKLNLVATINDKTTAGVTLNANGTIGKSSTTVVAKDFFIDFVDGEYFAKLKYGDIASADVGSIGVLGTVFANDYTGISPSESAGTADATHAFEGVWAKWSMLNGEWTGISEVDQFYTVKGQFDNFGAFVSFDKTSPTKPATELMDIIAGADLNYTFDDEVTNVKLDAAYQVLSAGYGAQAALTTKLGDEDKIGVTLAGYYATAAFAPTATALTTGKYQGSAAVDYLFDFGDLEQTKATLAYTYRAITATNAVDKSEVKATMDFTIAGTETAKLEGAYRLDTSNIIAYGDYLNYPIDDEGKWKASAIGKYNVTGAGWDESGAAEYYGILTLDYAYSDTTSFQLEGRWDSTPAVGAPNYSAYAEVMHTLAANTTLEVYYELNTWDVDEDYAANIGVNDGLGTLWSRLEVTF